VAAASAILLFTPWPGIFDLDEGIYAAALTEMLHRKDMIIPTLHGLPFLEKPILIYWAAAPLVSLGFLGDLALRLPSVLASIGTLMIIGRFANRVFGPAVARGSVLIVASSVLFVAMARLFTPDALLTFFLTAAIVATWSACGGSRGHWPLVGLCLGAGLLAKGPISIAIYLPVALAIALSARLRAWQMVASFGFSLILAISVAAVWYVPAYLRAGDTFISEFLLRQNIGRAMGGDTAHTGPLWFYLPILFVALFPYVIASIGASVGAPSKEQKRAALCLAVWAGTTFLIFSIAGSKLPHYILPCIPPLAILLAWRLDTAGRGFAVEAPIACLIFAALFLFVSGLKELVPYKLLLWTFAGVFVLGALSFLFSVIRKQSVVAQCAVPAVTLSVLLLIGAPFYWNETQSGPHNAAVAARTGDLAVIEYRTGRLPKSGSTAHPSMTWYLGKPTVAVEKMEALLNALNRTSGAAWVVSRAGRLDAEVDYLSQGGWAISKSQFGDFQLYLAKR
jgi:4-amino-4-deoxy-L-arabinose transferase-like glycosyltransferase